MMGLCIVAAAMWLSTERSVVNRIVEQHQLTRRPRDGPITNLDVAADIELFAACLRSGVTQAVAADAVSQVSRSASAEWASVAALLSIGVPAATAWHPLAGIPELSELIRQSTFSQHTGSSLAALCERSAQDIRSRSADAATAAAQRAGVVIAIPLTVCFLPAFLILGLVPIIINLATSIINN